MCCQISITLNKYWVEQPKEISPLGNADLITRFLALNKITVTFSFNETAMALKRTGFSSAKFAAKRRITHRKQFLEDMEQVVPWAKLGAVLAVDTFQPPPKPTYNSPLAGVAQW